jgi:hypothetical protein
METHTHTQMHTHTDIGVAVEHQKDGQGNSQQYSIYFVYVINTPRHSHLRMSARQSAKTGRKYPLASTLMGRCSCEEKGGCLFTTNQDEESHCGGVGGDMRSGCLLVLLP